MIEPMDVRYGALIRQMRRTAKLRTKQLAVQAGVSVQYLTHLELGGTIPSRALADRLHNFLQQYVVIPDSINTLYEKCYMLQTRKNRLCYLLRKTALTDADIQELERFLKLRS